MFATLIRPTQPRGFGVGFTDRLGGVSLGSLGELNLGRTDLDEVDRLRSNMAAVRRAAGFGPVVAVHQVHGSQVHLADGDARDWSGDAWLGDRITGAAALPVADAVVSTIPGLALMVRVADCVPVVLADPAARVVAVAHAGRVGLLGGVLEQTLAVMQAAGARELTAWIGPHICGRCYEVPAAMALQAAEQLPACAARTSWGAPAIDLGAGAAVQLTEAGVRVHRVEMCTLTTASLYSHRGDGPNAGRQIGLVWLSA